MRLTRTASERFRVAVRVCTKPTVPSLIAEGLSKTQPVVLASTRRTGTRRLSAPITRRKGGSCTPSNPPRGGG